MCFGQMKCHLTLKVCLCEQDKFFSNSTLECTDKLSINETCDNDWQCLNKSGLTCQESKCQCDANLFSWSNHRQKCMLTYSKQSCDSSDDCNPDQNLKCINEGCDCPSISIVGMCDCHRSENNEEFWNGTHCTYAKNYTDLCSINHECQTITQNTTCIEGSCICSDYTLVFWNGQKCQFKKRYSESCNNNSECLNSDLTSCFSNTCSCETNQYYDPELEKCVSRLSENEVCTSDEMCFGQMKCHLTLKVCLCEQDKFFSNSTLECTDKLSINETCDNDWQCLNKSGLTCQESKCQCDANLFTWDFSINKCRLTYSKFCNSTYDCNAIENLFCYDFSNRCACPSNCLFRICDCSASSDKYWNGKSCVNRKLFNLQCNFSYECSINNSLVCIQNKCQCDITKRYNNVSQKCEGNFPNGSIYFENQLFYLSSNKTIKASQVKSECEKLNMVNGKKWEAAVILNAATNNFLKEYLAKIGSSAVYWIDMRDKKDENDLNDDEWKENVNKIKIDYSFCPYGKGRISEPMHYKIDCFYDNITSANFDHFFMRRLPLY